MRNKMYTQSMADRCDRLTKWVKPAVLHARAYETVHANGMIKLDAMENPFTWPKAIQQAWLAALVEVDVNRYPNELASDMATSLRRVLDVPDSSGVLFGNGSDEIIQMLLLSLRPDSGGVLVPEPTFSMYRHIAAYIGLHFHGVPLGPDFALNADAMLAAIRQHQPGIIFLACPNNPTGNLFDRAVIEAIVEAAPGLVVMDEAYHIFSGQSSANLLNNHDHVLIMRTLSKLGLAGLRIGILFGAPQWILQFEKIRLPYNIGTLNQVTTTFIAEHIGVLEQQARTLVEQRDLLFTEMAQIEQVRVWPSKANFLLFKVKPAAAIHQALQAKGVLIKNLDNTHPQLQDGLRVTIGTHEQNALFLQALQEVVQAQ